MPRHFKYKGEQTTAIRKECKHCIDNRKTLCDKDFCWLPHCKYDNMSRSNKNNPKPTDNKQSNDPRGKQLK